MGNTFSEMLVTIYQTTWCQILEDTMYLYCHDNRNISYRSMNLSRSVFCHANNCSTE